MTSRGTTDLNPQVERASTRRDALPPPHQHRQPVQSKHFYRTAGALRCIISVQTPACVVEEERKRKDLKTRLSRVGLHSHVVLHPRE